MTSDRDHSTPPMLGGRRTIRVPWLRRSIEATTLLVAAALVSETWCARGLFAPLEIHGGSMAGALVGPHCRFVCAGCATPLVCGVEPHGQHVAPWRVCPHCGAVARNAPPPEVLPGDRVVVLPTALSWRSPRRWEIVAIVDPGQPRRLAVKRVVGLPGEAIELREGDVYADGQIVRKPLERQTAMATLVYESSAGGGASRWRANAADSGWSDSDGVFRHDGARRDKVDWLVYHHFRRVGDHFAESPVVDELSYNQWRTQPDDQTFPVSDLALRFRAAGMAGDGWLVFRADAAAGLELWYAPTAGRCELRARAETICRAETVPVAPGDTIDIVLSLFDRQLLLAVGGRLVMCHDLSASDSPIQATSRPLAIGSTGLAVKISGLRIDRDVYYRRPPGVYARWGFDRPVKLGPGEYFVLGDNSLISEDSRSWPTGPAVPESRLLGKVVAVHIP